MTLIVMLSTVISLNIAMGRTFNGLCRKGDDSCNTLVFLMKLFMNLVVVIVDSFGIGLTLIMVWIDMMYTRGRVATERSHSRSPPPVKPDTPAATTPGDHTPPSDVLLLS